MESFGGLFLVVGVEVEFVFAFGDVDGADGVARDVERGGGHVAQAVDAGKYCYAFKRYAYRREHHREHEQAAAGDAGSAKGGHEYTSSKGDNMLRFKLNTIHLCQKDGAHGLKEGRAIHVKRAAKGHNKVCKPF